MVSRSFAECVDPRRKRWLVCVCMRDMGTDKTCSLRQTPQRPFTGRRAKVPPLLLAN